MFHNNNYNNNNQLFSSLDMTSPEQIRPIIECFCQILSLYGFSSIKVDDFLGAKFDEKQPVSLTSNFRTNESLSNVLIRQLHSGD